MKTLRLGTRGSKLALIQAHHVKDMLLKAHDDIAVDIVEIKTSGDWKPEHGEVSLEQAEGGKGQFIKEIEKALDADLIDFGVHSLKDVPADLPERFSLSHILERENPFDALISADKSVKALSDLPKGAVIGTSSKRRAMFALSKRPDCRVEILRGNVDTRLKKLADGQVDATFLAMAGLVRMGLMQHVNAQLSAEDMVPCACQGAIGLEIRADDAEISAYLDALSHEETTLRCMAERQALYAMQASCHTPIGVFAEFGENHQLSLRIVLGYEDAKQMTETQMSATVATQEDAVLLGQKCAEDLMHKTPQSMQDDLGVRLVD